MEKFRSPSMMRKETKKIKHYKQVNQGFSGYGKPSEIDVFESGLDKKSMGELLKTLRKCKNLTQEQLGKLIGVDKTEISKLERGNRNLTISRLIQLLDALLVTTKLKIEVRDNKTRK
ncbi:MAG: helix-turn-helix transcriptional regulator [Bacteroidetes bacterium]|nr:helix-turn-helix transcriptional regulator [Bacteroidota bacterium]